MVNCNDMEDVSSFALRQYVALTGREEAEHYSEMFTLTLATIVRNLMDGVHLRSEVAPGSKDAWVHVVATIVRRLLDGIRLNSGVSESGKDAWVHALIPENVQSPICNTAQTLLSCCAQ